MAEEITNEELARMIAKGFQGVDKQLANIKGDIERIDDRMNGEKPNIPWQDSTERFNQIVA